MNEVMNRRVSDCAGRALTSLGKLPVPGFTSGLSSAVPAFVSWVSPAGEAWDPTSLGDEKGGQVKGWSPDG